MVRILVFLELLVEGTGFQQVHAAVIVGLTNTPIEVIWILPMEAVARFPGFEVPAFLQRLGDDPWDCLVDRAGVGRDGANLFEGEEAFGGKVNPWIGFEEISLFLKNCGVAGYRKTELTRLGFRERDQEPVTSILVPGLVETPCLGPAGIGGRGLWSSEEWNAE